MKEEKLEKTKDFWNVRTRFGLRPPKFFFLVVHCTERERDNQRPPMGGRP